jgi:hypothetical protein
VRHWERDSESITRAQGDVRRQDRTHSVWDDDSGIVRKHESKKIDKDKKERKKEKKARGGNSDRSRGHEVEG